MAVMQVTEPAMLDSTGQEIKDSIDALTTALTTEKANRDASNVTNASAWRSAIGANALFQTKTYTTSYTVGGNGAGSITANDFEVSTPSGYSVIGVVDFATQSTSVDIRGVYGRATGSSTMMSLRNVTSTSVTATAYITLLYAKSAFL